MPADSVFVFDWTVNVPNIITWVIGSILIIAAIFLRDWLATRRETRLIDKEMQNWFVETYIVNGAEVLLAYVSNIIINNLIHRNMRAVARGYPIPGQNIDLSTIALNRVHQLIGGAAERTLFIRLGVIVYQPDFPFPVEIKKEKCEEIAGVSVRFAIDIERCLAGLINDIRALEIKDKKLDFKDPVKLDSISKKYDEEFEKLDKRAEKIILSMGYKPGDA